MAYFFSLESIRGCPHCGLFTELPATMAGVDINCPRCARLFSRVHNLTMDHALAFAITGLIFCMVLMTSPFLDVSFYGRHQASTLWRGPQILDQQELMMLAAVVLFTTLLLPILKLGLLIAVLLALKLENPPPLTVPMFRWANRISRWAMLEVYLLGFLVAYTRLEVMAYIKIDIAVYALVGAMLSMTLTDYLLDKEEVWNLMREKGLADDLGETSDHDVLGCHTCNQASKHPAGTPCPRCQSELHPRKPASISRAWAFLIAAMICYIPANTLPVMESTSFGWAKQYTITGGMLELSANGLWPLALLVFVASIAIPFLKMLILCYLLITTHNGSRANLATRTRLYRIIDFIGRWSMVDIFMISILVSLMHFGLLAQINAETGAIYFAAVVILTMLAVESFDARLMWDRADENGQPQEAAHG